MVRRGRLYVSHDANVNETTALKDVWEKFPYPTNGYTEVRKEGDWVCAIDSSTFTWNGKPCWHIVDATANIYRGSGVASQNRNCEFQWYKNGLAFGVARGSYFNNQDSQIMSGHGWMYLETGDSVSPWIRNTESDDKILIKNCCFTFYEDSGY